MSTVPMCANPVIADQHLYLQPDGCCAHTDTHAPRLPAACAAAEGIYPIVSGFNYGSGKLSAVNYIPIEVPLPTVPEATSGQMQGITTERKKPQLCSKNSTLTTSCYYSSRHLRMCAYGRLQTAAHKHAHTNMYTYSQGNGREMIILIVVHTVQVSLLSYKIPYSC